MVYVNVRSSNDFRLVRKSTPSNCFCAALSPKPPSAIAATASEELDQSGTPSPHNAHYDEVATFYEKAWFYKPGSDYQRWCVSNTLERLDVRKGERVVDFGGGDGAFSLSLHHTYADLPATTLVMDPSPGMLEKVNVTAAPPSHSSCRLPTTGFAKFLLLSKGKSKRIGDPPWR
jgi:hypothetical protein